MKRPKKVWHREDIKATVRKRGSTLRAISVAAGYSANTGTVALTKPMPGPQKTIANFLGLSLHDLWPNWYDQQGQRIDARSTRKATPKRGGCHRKKTAPESASESAPQNSPHHPDKRSARQARGEGVAASPVATPTHLSSAAI
jgi:Ner family transcriptional regulator